MHRSRLIYPEQAPERDDYITNQCTTVRNSKYQSGLGRNTHDSFENLVRIVLMLFLLPRKTFLRLYPPGYPSRRLWT